MLTIQILVDETTEIENLEVTLANIEDLFPSWWCSVIIGHNSMSWVGKLRSKHAFKECIVDYSLGRDVCRNQLMSRAKTRWNMWLHPGETLSDQIAEIADVVNNDGTPMSFAVINDDAISHQTRLWSDGRFSNRAYEKLNVDGKVGECVIFSRDRKFGHDELDLIESWPRENPTQPKPFYYRACSRLSLGDRKGFLEDAKTYLFIEGDKTSESSMMMRYYIACLLCYEDRDAGGAIGNIMVCIAQNPTMAEFWCLLGDVYYHILRKYEKASSFYENALVLGRSREKNGCSMEISKYEEYPNKMIDSCLKIVHNSKKLGKIRTTHSSH